MWYPVFKYSFRFVFNIFSGFLSRSCALVAGECWNNEASCTLTQCWCNPPITFVFYLCFALSGFLALTQTATRAPVEPIVFECDLRLTMQFLFLFQIVPSRSVSPVAWRAPASLITHFPHDSMADLCRNRYVLM